MLIEKNIMGGNVYELETMESDVKVKIGVNPKAESVPFSLIVTEEANPFLGRLIDRFSGFNMNEDQLEELIRDLQAAKESMREGEDE